MLDYLSHIILRIINQAAAIIYDLRSKESDDRNILIFGIGG